MGVLVEPDLYKLTNYKSRLLLFTFKNCTQNCVHYSTNFLCDPVVLESICYGTRAKRLINESNTTGGQIKNLDGCRALASVCSTGIILLIERARYT